MSEQLKPCPFCGGEAKIEKMNIGGKPAHFAVSCQAGGCMAYVGWYNSEAEAAAVWNHRTPEIVRCGECRHKYNGHCFHGPMATEAVRDDFGCTEGQRREKEGRT